MQVPFNPTTSESDFRRFRQISALYVDKSFLIRDILRNTETSIVLLRPRRFGKTLNLSMLEYFFSNKETDINRPSFDGLAITEDAASMAHFGQYPTIFLTVKDIKEETYEGFLRKVSQKISALYRQYPELLTSEQLVDKDKQDINAFIEETTDLQLLGSSVALLSLFLHKHYNKKVLILLDEYDTPINESYLAKPSYYKHCVNFMRSFLGSAFKGNNAMFKGVITGILQVGKESIFSDVNNLKIYSMLDDKWYASYFGFTDAEVAELVRIHDVLSLEELRHWYNSYTIQGVRLYNPFSVMNAFHDHHCGPYWMNSSSNGLIRDVIGKSEPNVKKEVAVLLQEGSIRKRVNSKTVFTDLHQTDVLWGLLVATGYLSASDWALDEDGYACYTLSVPNHEVKMMYQQMVNYWFTEQNAPYYTVFLDAIVQGNALILERAINVYLCESVSFFEINANTPESTYMVFMLGIVAGLKNRYVISSNVEVGYGRCDVMMSPKDKTQTGIIIEFKRCEDGDFAKSNEEAFEQIALKQYATKLQAEDIMTIRLFAISFCGQKAHVEMR